MIIYDINLLIDIAYKIRLNVQGNKHFSYFFSASCLMTSKKEIWNLLYLVPRNSANTLPS